MGERAEFIASFPGTQSAISFHGSGGMRIQLDIPENQIGEAAKLLMWREQLLNIVVSPIPKEQDNVDDSVIWDMVGGFELLEGGR